MYLEYILIISMLIAIVAAGSQRQHILIALLGLEATALILAALYTANFSTSSEEYLGILFLTLAAAETASALGLLSTLSRFSGSDNINSISLLMISQ